MEPHNLMASANLLEPKMPPKGADAVAGILVLEGGEYLMQLRDDKPGIYYPGHWGCFGGALEDGEDPMTALQRELDEELRLPMPRKTEYFTRFDFDLGCIGQQRVFRIFYTVAIQERELSSLVLCEGTAMKAFAGGELLSRERVVPYDAFAIWLHYRLSLSR